MQAQVDARREIAFTTLKWLPGLHFNAESGRI
jgi:hypothetical protein